MTSYRVNDDGVSKARQLIEGRQYDLETPWSDAAPTAEASNEMIERHGLDGFAEWHLAVDVDASEDTKGRYRFPFGDYRRVNRAALIHAKQRAAQNGHDAVVDAADSLLQLLDDTPA
jgi:hypothetical protein